MIKKNWFIPYYFDYNFVSNLSSSDASLELYFIYGNTKKEIQNNAINIDWAPSADYTIFLSNQSLFKQCVSTLIVTFV